MGERRSGPNGTMCLLPMERVAASVVTKHQCVLVRQAVGFSYVRQHAVNSAGVAALEMHADCLAVGHVAAAAIDSAAGSSVVHVSKLPLMNSA